MRKSLTSVIYGPVPSWRLGRSLGVDMVSQRAKTCSFDCVYCQLGPTRCHKSQRREFVSIARLKKELEELPPLELEYVTFSGTAEPTLAVNLGEAITAVRGHLPVPVAVLSNSSLMSDPKVRADLALADVVVAKLDAPTEALFRKVNRPAPGITLARTVEALRLFRREYRGRLALQMMFFDANESCAEALAALARELAPDEVQVNTPLRPCAVQPLSADAIGRIQRAFGGVRVVSVYEARRPEVDPLDVQETAARRPESWLERPADAGLGSKSTQPMLQGGEQMPRGDGTGPMGMGPMTGRAAGYCAGYAAPGFVNPVSGRGLGMAWGRGGGLGRGLAMRRGRGRAFGFVPAPFVPAPTREQELDMLRSQADWLKDQMDAINQRIGELDQQKS